MLKRLKLRLVVYLAWCVVGLAASVTLAEGDGDVEFSPLQIFDQRILPIFRSPEPSSCVQCHLASVDLKNYILPSHEKTFVSLRDQGMIDFAQPEQSKILTLIRMGEKDLDDGARLIHEQMRQAEYEAFAAWIKACCNDSTLRQLPPLSIAEHAKPDRPDEVIRHARKSRIVDSFVRNVWSQRMRCFPCHTPHEIDPSNPRQQAALKTLKKFEDEYDDDLMQRLEIFRETPEATMQYLIEKSQLAPPGDLPLINLQQPEKSLLVLKPMSKLPEKDAQGKFKVPSSSEPVFHLGGLKMHPDDQSYKSFIAWIKDYANVVGNRYASVSQLPADNWHPSKRVLKLSSAPADWPVGTPVQLFVHPWSETDATWEQEPIAFTQGTVTPRRMVNGALFLLAPTNLEETKSWDHENALVARGKYVVKVYVDLNGRVGNDPTILLGSDDFAGQAELKKPRWREGFPHAETISGKSLIQN